MFKSTGEKLQKVSKVLFIFTIIVSIVLLIVGYNSCSANSKYGYGFDTNTFVYILLFCVFSVFSSYIGSLVLSGFGELIENISSMKYKMDTIENYVEKKTKENK